MICRFTWLYSTGGSAKYTSGTGTSGSDTDARFTTAQCDRTAPIDTATAALSSGVAPTLVSSTSTVYCTPCGSVTSVHWKATAGFSSSAPSSGTISSGSGGGGGGARTRDADGKKGGYPWTSSFNGADFYDLFGPTKTSRKGYTGSLRYDGVLVSEAPRSLRKGKTASLRGGVVRAVDLRVWMAYQIEYLPFLPWMFVAAMLAIIGLTVHFARRFLPAMAPAVRDDKEGALAHVARA